MSRILKSRKGRIGLGLIAALAMTTFALAYWTTTGDGDGTADVGTDADNVSVVGTASGGTLAPGGPARTVSFTAANPAEFNQSISTIKLVEVEAYPTAADRTAGTNVISDTVCGGSNSASDDFEMADVTVPPATDGDIEPGATAQALTTTGSIHMNNLDSDQDGCKNAALKLIFETE